MRGNRIRRRLIGWGSSLAFFVLFTRSAAAADAAKPNIVLCMTDDQGWGDVSYNGLKAVRTTATGCPGKVFW
jgi:hypothetical protein